MDLGTAGTVTGLTSKTLDKLAETRISIVDFWASWCVPCRKLAPAYEAACAEISSKRPGEVGFFKVNVEQEPSLADSYGVMNIPAVIAFSGRKPLDRFSGRLIKEDLVRWIEKLAGNG
jgi:thioredoxin